ncbi:MAG: polysaccharide biosynthesis/export family protein [Bacteroidota bacterium]
MRLTPFIFLAVIVLLNSCSINKDIMFRTDTEFDFTKPNLDSTNNSYQLAPFDYVTVNLFTGNGAMIFDYSTSGVDVRVNFAGFELYYILDEFGEVELPVIGKVKIGGMTIPEAQDFLEKQFVNYNNPYCLIRVINKRALVFTGEGSKGAVVPLTNQQVSVIEAIAVAGGVQKRGNASKIKLIRNINGKEEVYRIDLSTIAGIQDARMVVQSGDIIYVEPVPQLTTEFIQDISPIINFISAASVLFIVITR